MADKLAAIIRAAQREHGEALIKIAEDTRAANVFRISTGIFILDYAIGGGIPIGRTSIVYGKKSAGKSSLMAKVICNAQRMCRKCLGPVVSEIKEVSVPTKKLLDNGTVVDAEEKRKKHVAVDCTNKCRMQDVDEETRKPKGKEYWPGAMKTVWVDAEGSFHVPFYTAFGVDCGMVWLVNTEYGEQAIDIVDSMIRTGQVDLVVVDSIAALTPLKEREGSAEDWNVALQARIINKAMRVWTSSLNELEVSGRPTDCTILLSNQTRQKPGQMFPVEVLPAGVGQEFTSSLEIRLKQKGFQFDTGARPVWQDTQFIIEKNRCGVPKMQGFYRMCLLEHPGRKPGDTWDDMAVADQAISEGFLKKDGEKMLCIGKKFENEAAFRDEVSKMSDLYRTLRSRLLELMIGRPSTGELAKKEDKDKDK